MRGGVAEELIVFSYLPNHMAYCNQIPRESNLSRAKLLKIRAENPYISTSFVIVVTSNSYLIRTLLDRG